MRKSRGLGRMAKLLQRERREEKRREEKRSEEREREREREGATCECEREGKG